jgi:hypothetical protein
MRTRTLIACAVLCAAALASNDALAWNWGKCGNTYAHWPADSATLRASSVGFPVGPWRDALASVRDRFNTSPSQLNYTLLWNEPAVAMNNGQSEVWWQAELDWPAAAWYWVNGSCEIVEADVIFRSTVAYTTSTAKATLTAYGGPNRPFRTTAIHEFGHAQGAGHVADIYSVMGTDFTHIHANGGTGTAYVGEDLISGSVAVYGLDANAGQDLAIAHWRRSGASGEYSSHSRTRVFTTGNAELAKVAGATEPTYKVNKGQTVKFEMTYENMGRTSPLTVKIGYYLSTNDTISTGDTFLGEGQVTLYRGAPDTTNNTYLNIPSNLVSGTTYWLGAIIDYNGAVNEVYEANNATYTAIRVN